MDFDWRICLEFQKDSDFSHHYCEILIRFVIIAQFKIHGEIQA